MYIKKIIMKASKMSMEVVDRAVSFREEGGYCSEKYFDFGFE